MFFTFLTIPNVSDIFLATTGLFTDLWGIIAVAISIPLAFWLIEHIIGVTHSANDEYEEYGEEYRSDVREKYGKKAKRGKIDIEESRREKLYAAREEAGFNRDQD